MEFVRARKRRGYRRAPGAAKLAFLAALTLGLDRGLSFMPPKVTDQRVFAVYFTKDKKVDRVANYGMEDGKLIDFVSRTTPTAGAESTFLKGMFINLLHF